jgi:hypothetical protein
MRIEFVNKNGALCSHGLSVIPAVWDAETGGSLDASLGSRVRQIDK